MKGSLHTFVYAAVLGTVCALCLTTASQVLKPYQDANREAERVKNVLQVLGAEVPEKARPDELVAIFKKNVRESKKGDLELYEYTPGPGDDVQAVAVEFSGRGLWGPIKGYLSLDPEMKTIRGITFYQQEETPGLGGEIESDDFRKQFVGKSIESADGTPGIRILRSGQATADNEVDAITGATMTCGKVEQMLNAAIERIVKERD